MEKRFCDSVKSPVFPTPDPNDPFSVLFGDKLKASPTVKTPVVSIDNN